MDSTASPGHPWWIPTAVIVACLVVIGLLPLGVLLIGRILPDGLLYPLVIGPQYIFPANSLRVPDLPAGMQPGAGFRNRLGGGPVVLIWVVIVLAFGFLARRLSPWQAFLAALGVIVVVTVLMHAVMHHFGFHLELEFL